MGQQAARDTSTECDTLAHTSPHAKHAEAHTPPTVVIDVRAVLIPFRTRVAHKEQLAQRVQRREVGDALFECVQINEVHRQV